MVFSPFLPPHQNLEFLLIFIPWIYQHVVFLCAYSLSFAVIECFLYFLFYVSLCSYGDDERLHRAYVSKFFKVHVASNSLWMKRSADVVAHDLYAIYVPMH